MAALRFNKYNVNVRENRKRQSRMNNPEKQAILDTRHRAKPKNAQHRRGNQELTTQRNKQYWTQDTEQRQKMHNFEEAIKN